MIDANEGLLGRLRKLNLGAPRPAPAAPGAGLVTIPGGAAGVLPGAVERLAAGPVHVANWSFPSVYVHGAESLHARRDQRPLMAAAASRDPRFRDLDPSTWLFLDTETTSLNSGAGVWVFMVGIGWAEGDEFRVRQFLLVDPGSEFALLEAVHERIGTAGALVSFHGKSFDAPRLDDRFRLAGLDPIMSRRPHLDLLHPMRRLHGQRLPDCRLRTIEEDVLRFRRVNDLPGALCPDAYFAYLRGRPHRLAEVFEHNKLDVLSLSALAGYLAGAYRGDCRRCSPLRAGLDWAEVGDLVRARPFLVAGAAEGAKAPISVALSAARLLRKLGEGLQARQLLVDLSARNPADPRPVLALKRLERRRQSDVAAGAAAAS
jgi:uncharacterized protein YprB with RNaseH-like and TPR domain